VPSVSKRLASAALPPGHPVYAITVAAIIEMALLNCTQAVAAEHVVATFAVDSLEIAHRFVPD
jgi:hypothetical protein